MGMLQERVLSPLIRLCITRKIPNQVIQFFLIHVVLRFQKQEKRFVIRFPPQPQQILQLQLLVAKRITCAAAMNDGGSYYEDDSRPIYHYTNVPNVYYSDRTCNNVFNGDGWKDNCKLDVGFEVRENGAPGVNLSDLYCNKNGTGIVYKPGTNSISVATDKCLNTYNFKRSCLKLVASDLGWFTGFTGNNYIYCCSADSYCSE